VECHFVRRNWTGNDESRRNHVGVVYLSESSLRLKLSWKEGRNSPVHLIGVFDLDLRHLLEGGYVRAGAFFCRELQTPALMPARPV
jgi:hypothetical protein